jgi:hypothetical protein
MNGFSLLSNNQSPCTGGRPWTPRSRDRKTVSPRGTPVRPRSAFQPQGGPAKGGLPAPTTLPALIKA